MPKRDNECCDCIFWARQPRDGNKLLHGWCHRRAPAPIIDISGLIGRAPNVVHSAYWPDTIETDFCGEFEGRAQR